MIAQLQRTWRENLQHLVCNAKQTLFISSPFVTQNGVDFVKSNLKKQFKNEGELIFLTNLSPSNILQGSNSPDPFISLKSEVNNLKLWHLPKLHAKVYISDKNKSIVTSGNLTNGGLYSNFEYGIQINDSAESAKIYDDINNYCQLGSKLDFNTLQSLSEIAKGIAKKREKVQSEVSKEINELLFSAQDELVKDRLQKGATHNVFAKTILYVLYKYPQGLSTEDIHLEVKEIHPDLCDNSVDRIIEGKSFGKKWKHAVRTAQQHLKKNSQIVLNEGIWRVK
ncbi:MAG: hypothetical protein CMO34_05215 [Verrucomicrobia bacterium]|nr:hypothetical protein [Verrucomicrobiota bacterium]|tara:strand:- start:1342 stop:2184 length:843 start_codon:yes stop_codon:yes gene_type:complete